MNAQASVIDPGDIPAVSLGSMNQTHQEEVVLIYALGDLLRAVQEGEEEWTAIDQALDEWVRHTEAHFARENKLMEKYGFPPYPVHSREHATVLVEIRRLQSAWLSDRQIEPLADYLFNRWHQWFIQQVNTMDASTARFLSNFIDRVA